MGKNNSENKSFFFKELAKNTQKRLFLRMNFKELFWLFIKTHVTTRLHHNMVNNDLLKVISSTMKAMTFFATHRYFP